MPEQEAAYHISRCVDSGLWVPGGAESAEGDAESPADKDKADDKTKAEDTEETYEEVD